MKKYDSEMYVPKNPKTDRKYTITVQAVENAMDWAKLNKKQFPVSLTVGLKEGFSAVLPPGVGLAPYMVSLVKKDIERRFRNGELTEQDRIDMLSAYDEAREVHVEKMQKQHPDSMHLQAQDKINGDEWMEKMRDKSFEPGKTQTLEETVVNDFSYGLTLENEDTDSTSSVSDTPIGEYGPKNGAEKDAASTSANSEIAQDNIIPDFSYGLKLKK